MSKYRETCEKLIEYLNEMKIQLDNGSHYRFHNAMENFFRLIQSDRSFFICDPDKNIIGNHNISYLDDVYYYGIKGDFEYRTIILNMIKVVITIECEPLPINRLLNCHFILSPLIVDHLNQSIDELIAFYLDCIRGTEVPSFCSS